MEKIDFKKQNIPFTQVANGVLNDTHLSFNAKGLYAYLYSKPDGWYFSTIRIAEDSQDGRHLVRKGIKELEVAGYLFRQKQPSGRYLYKLIYPPIEQESIERTLGQEPSSELPTVQSTHSAQNGRLSNKEERVIKNTSNKDSRDEISLFIDLFKEVNPTHSRLFANKTERASATRLLDKFGREKMFGLVGSLKEIINQPYAPRITTPYQLERDLGKLIVFIKQGKKNKVGIIT